MSFRILVFLGLGFTFGISVAQAQTPLVRDPLYELSADICKIDLSQKDSDVITARKTLSGKIVPVTKNLQNSKELLGVPGEQTAFWEVKRDHLLAKMLARYPVEVDYATLLKTGTDFKDALSTTLTPCKPPKVPKGTQLSSLPEDCTDPNRYSSAADRFKDKPNALRFRRALLRMFEVAETGTSRHFVVIRRPFDPFNTKRDIKREADAWNLTETDLDNFNDSTERFVVDQAIYQNQTTEIQSQISQSAIFETDSLHVRDQESISPLGFWQPLNYRPLVDAGADDVIIHRYLNDEERPPFIILCRDVSIRGSDKKIKKTHAVTVDNPAYSAAQFQTVSQEVKVENALPQKYAASTVGDSLTKFKTGLSWGSKKNKEVKHTLKPALVKNSRQFGRLKPDGAEVGINLVGKDASKTDDDDDNNTLVIDAAVGLTYEFRPKKADNPKNRIIPTWRGTVFASLSQAPTDFAFFKLVDPGNPLSLEGEEADKKIAFADISIGGRIEYDSLGAVIPPKYDQRTGRTQSSLVGQRLPGFRGALTAEYLTDNYEFQRGERYGIDVSLPKKWYVPGFRQKQELIRRSPLDVNNTERSASSPSIGRHLTGWSIEWDLQPALDYLDWDKNRSPFNFETHKPDDRIKAQSLEGFVYGANLEFDLYKSNLFGAVLKDNYFNFSVDYLFRRGYTVFVEDDTLPVAEQMLTASKSGHLTLAATISHPDFSNLSYGVTWQKGEDIRTLSPADTLSVNFGAKY